MRLTIDFRTDDLTLPIQYNHLVQALIYRSLDPEFGEFLHNQGYQGGGRIFKLFAFSRLLGEYRMEKGLIHFGPKVKLVVTSPLEPFCQSLLNGLLTRTSVQLGDYCLHVESVQVAKPQICQDSLKFRTLSPVVAYKTLIRPEGGKYTCYFQPGESDFARITAENLRKKYQAVIDREPPAGEITVRPMKQPKLHVLEYKGLVIKAYSGILELKGPQQLLQLALEAGLGSKNSMGFGCGEIMDTK